MEYLSRDRPLRSHNTLYLRGGLEIFGRALPRVRAFEQDTEGPRHASLGLVARATPLGNAQRILKLRLIQTELVPEPNQVAPSQRLIFCVTCLRTVSLQHINGAA